MFSALIASDAGVIGNKLATYLNATRKQVAAIARHPHLDLPRSSAVVAELLDSIALAKGKANSRLHSGLAPAAHRGRHR